MKDLTIQSFSIHISLGDWAKGIDLGIGITLLIVPGLN